MENKERIKFIKEFTEVDGISGHEKNASRVFKKYVDGYYDELSYDNLGSIIAKKNGTDDLKIMIAGHIDEIGFLVSKIEPEGYLRLHPIGGWWPHVLLSQRLEVCTSEGKKFMGIVGSTAPHVLQPDQRNKVMDLKQVYVDLGIAGKEAVEKLGIRPGDPVTPVAEFMQLADPKYWAAKAFDDRLGAAVGIEVLRNLKGKSHPNAVYAVGTVQEEVGLRGARTAVYAVKPDIAFALDVTIAGDVPGMSTEAKLGKGISISFADGSVIGHKALINTLIDICKEKNIPYTFDMLAAGGTDSGAIHLFGEGVVNCTLSIPARYIHSHYGIVHETDYLAAIDLLTEFCLRCDRKMYQKLQESKR